MLALAGCTPTTSYWSEVQAPKENKIEPVRLVHDIKFTSGTQISPVEAAQLEGFLARHDIGYGDRVYVLIDSAAKGPSAERSRSVLEYMASPGVWGEGLPSPEAQAGLGIGRESCRGRV